MRTDPPPSVPTDHVPMPSPTAVAAPPLEPPDVRPAPHGLPVAPWRIESVTPFQANSGVVFFPSSTAPLSRRRATAGASTSQGWAPSTSVEPRSVGQPRVSSMSLIEAGTPSAGPSGFPARQRRVDALACASAACSSTRTNALTSPSWARMASSAARAASSG